MIIDFDLVEAPPRLEADICIIGAGAAGITFARTFIGTTTKVILLESGGEEFEEDTQNLYSGENLGLPYELDTSRLRFLGGTTNHWEGVCGPLDAEDFEVRNWVPYSGWPFSIEELDRYYEMAQTICGVGPKLYGSGVWDYIKRTPLELDPGKLQYGFRQMGESPVRFGEKYRDELAAADNIELFLHANVANIQLNADGKRVDYLDVRSLFGKEGKIYARYFILACGAIENARLMLVSDTVEPGGVGNQYDLVGRFFQEHPNFTIGELFAEDEDYILESFLQEFVDGIRFVQHLKMSPDLQSREGILNARIYLHEVLKPDTGVAAARELYSALRKGESIDDLDEKVWRVLMDIDDVAQNAYRRFVLGKGTRPPIDRIDINVSVEQAPNPNSRVTLSNETDALGLRRPRLNWVLTEMERETALALGRLLGAEFGRLGLGRIKFNDELLRYDGSPDIGFGYHQMGTTRMADDPRSGVVDANCLVHGVGNMYVAGSSIFPTGGNMNPTLTIVAMALRLSDRLKKQLAEDVI